MITFKPIVVPGNRRKDGTYLVYIRVTYKGKARRLPTHLTATPAQLTRTLKIKDDVLNAQAQQIITEMRESVSRLPYFSVMDADVDGIISMVRSVMDEERFTLDFFDYARTKFLPGMKENTRATYETALREFARSIDKDRLDINEITQAMIMQFVASKSDAGHKISAKTYYIRLKSIYKAAQDEYNDDAIKIPRNPFGKVKPERTFCKGQPNLGTATIQRMIDDATEVPAMRVALDAFLLSFCLYGANMEDLYSELEDVGDVWRNERNKTKDRRADRALVCIKIPEQARPYIRRLSRGCCKGWLKLLRMRYTTVDGATDGINRQLRKWAKAHKVEEFTFYAARHTFASLCRSVGTEKALVDEMLAHKGDFDMADIYAERNWDAMAEANKKMLDLFVWREQ